MRKGLTARQQRFVEEYVVDFNGAQAAIRAGYSKRTARQIAQENLTKPDVAAAIAEATGELSERTEITQEWVLSRLTTIVERCMQSEPVRDKQGNPVVVDTPTGERAPAYTFQAAAAIKSLEQLGKHIGMFVERKHVTGDLRHEQHHHLSREAESVVAEALEGLGGEKPKANGEAKRVH